MDLVLWLWAAIVIAFVVLGDWSWSIGIRTSAHYYGIGMSKEGTHLEFKIGDAVSGST